MMNLAAPAQRSGCANGDVKLLNSSSAENDRGKVEFCVGGEWRPICAAYYWTRNNDAAKVVCRQLGYRKPESKLS